MLIYQIQTGIYLFNTLFCDIEDSISNTGIGIFNMVILILKVFKILVSMPSSPTAVLATDEKRGAGGGAPLCSPSWVVMAVTSADPTKHNRAQ